MWIVTSDHPYYPQVSYHDSLVEAQQKAATAREEMFVEDGHNQIRMVVAEVISLEEGTSHY